MLYGLKQKDIEKLSKEGIEDLIKSNKELISKTASKTEKVKAMTELEDLEKILRNYFGADLLDN